jgi:hypothetical protein
MPNSQVKNNIQKITPIKKHCSEDKLIKFVEEVEVAVSKALTKDVIMEGSKNLKIFN